MTERIRLTKGAVVGPLHVWMRVHPRGGRVVIDLSVGGARRFMLQVIVNWPRARLNGWLA